MYWSSHQQGLHYDSKAALQVAINLIFHERTKYVVIARHVVRDKIKLGQLATGFTTFERQVVDLFAKALRKDSFYLHVENVGTIKIHAPT